MGIPQIHRRGTSVKTVTHFGEPDKSAWTHPSPLQRQRIPRRLPLPMESGKAGRLAGCHKAGGLPECCKAGGLAGCCFLGLCFLPLLCFRLVKKALYFCFLLFFLELLRFPFSLETAFVSPVLKPDLGWQSRWR